LINSAKGISVAVNDPPFSNGRLSGLYRTERFRHILRVNCC